jgi:hypothetical protein
MALQCKISEGTFTVSKPPGPDLGQHGTRPAPFWRPPQLPADLPRLLGLVRVQGCVPSCWAPVGQARGLASAGSSAAGIPVGSRGWNPRVAAASVSPQKCPWRYRDGVGSANGRRSTGTSQAKPGHVPRGGGCRLGGRNFACSNAHLRSRDLPRLGLFSWNHSCGVLAN